MSQRPLKKRLFYLIIDQLAGHWAEGVIVDEEELMPPANVLDYHGRGLIPNFSYIINEGIWVKRPWNRGVCDTGHGMKYLCTGTYDTSVNMGFFEYVKEKYKDLVKIAVFTTIPWAMRGYFYVPDYMISLPPYYRPYNDHLVWTLFVRPYLEREENWNMVHLYLALNDMVSHCPSYQKRNPHPMSSKHAYMLYLDKLVGEIISFLKNKEYWDETIIVIASDHGYHLGCEVCRNLGAKTMNWCCDHPTPYDCYVWDFERDRKTNKYSGGPRRITFIVSGGGLDDELRGSIVEKAEIIDVIPTIAKLIGVEFKTEGRSII